MIKNLFEVSREEKNRILRLHETATKKQYLIFEQNENPDPPSEFGPVNLGDHFEYGKHESEAVKADIQKLKPEIEKFISENTDYSKFEVKIEGGESRVTNPEGFEQQGSLALARANSVKKYFEEIFPEQIKSGVLVINAPTDVNQVEIGKTPYVRWSGDHEDEEKMPKYRAEQYVRFQIKGIGEKKVENENPAGCGHFFRAAENQGFGDFNADFTKAVDFNLTVESGEITIQTEAWTMPDILYISIDGKTDFINNIGYFQGLDAPYTRIFLGTALRAKYGMSLPDMLSSKGYTITVPDQRTLINNAEGIESWKLSSLNNIYGPGAPLQNDQWWKSLTDFDKNIKQNVQKRMRILLGALGSEFPWGYLNGEIRGGQGEQNTRFIGPIKINSPNKPQTLQVVNCAPNGKTQWSIFVSCKSQN